MKIIINCDNIKNEAMIRLASDILERIKERRLETYVEIQLRWKILIGWVFILVCL